MTIPNRVVRPVAGGVLLLASAFVARTFLDGLGLDPAAALAVPVAGAVALVASAPALTLPVRSVAAGVTLAIVHHQGAAFWILAQDRLANSSELGIYVASALAALGSVLLMWRLFLLDAGVIGLLTAGALLMLAHPAMSTVFSGQSNFILLFLVLLLWHRMRGARGGIWFGGTAAAIAVAAFALVGWSSTGLAPASLYEQGVNQSLLGVVLRATGAYFSFGGAVANYLYLNVALLILGISSFLATRRGIDPAVAAGMLVSVGLMVYPGTLQHHALLLVAPLLVIWARRDRVPGAAVAAAGFIAAAYGIMAIYDGQRAFVAMLLVWILLAGIAIRPGLEKRIRWVMRHVPPLRAQASLPQ
ncbi:MAG: hypothetical protein ACRDGD_04500 [Candidatus Limnocylindria bacterium]